MKRKFMPHYQASLAAHYGGGNSFAGGGGSSGPSGPAVDYILDQFTTNDASPVATNRNCQPGPGTLVFTQVDGTWAIASSKLACTAQSSVLTKDLAARKSATIARAAGLTLACDYNAGTLGQSYLGFWTGTDIDNAPENGLSLAATLGARLGAASVAIGELEAATDYRLAVVLGAAGAYYLAKGGDFGSTWKLLLRSFAGSTANLYVGLANDSAVATFDNLHAPIATVTIPTLLANAGAISAVTDLTTPDAIVDIAWKAASSLGAGIEILILRSDATGENGWALLRDEPGNLAIDKFESGEVAGSPTTLVATLWTGGATRYVQARIDGTTLRVWTRATKTGTWTAATPFDLDSDFATNTYLAPVAIGDGAFSDVVAFDTDQDAALGSV